MILKGLTPNIQNILPQPLIECERNDFLDPKDLGNTGKCDDNDIYHSDLEQVSFAFSYFLSHPDQYFGIDSPQFQAITDQKIPEIATIIPHSTEALQGCTSSTSENKRSKTKNSNTIKKYGRLILDNLADYNIPGRKNLGIDNMMKMLARKLKGGRGEVNKRDRFNTYHLKEILRTEDSLVNSHNLRITRIILNRHLRKNVLASKQINRESKMTYMNTLKCCSLRCVNTDLAVRLQMASEKRRNMIAKK